MARDDDFTPQLGRIRDRGRRGGKRFTKQVRSAARRLNKPRSRSGFTGQAIGSGNVIGRRAQLQTRRWQAFRARRVTAKVYIARARAGGGISAFRAHLNYIQRDGVELDGSGGELYTEAGRETDMSGFMARSEEDRHQFRIIVSAEDGMKLGDLKDSTRTLMSQMERDLATQLDWVAVDHHNTGHPHTHIIIRGKDAKGKDLVIAPDYIRAGIRSRAQEIVTETLGPRRDIEIAKAKYSEIERDRFTSIDRDLERLEHHGQLVLQSSPTSSKTRFDVSLQRQRLTHLESLHLAKEVRPDEWKMTDKWKSTLQSLGKRGDIIRTLTSKFGREDDLERLETWPPKSGVKHELIGSVWKDVPGDELKGTRALIVEDFHGNKWFVDASYTDPGTLPSNGAIVQFTTKTAEPRPSDHVISKIALANGGLYNEAIHQKFDPLSTSAFRLAHLRRLEALRRKAMVERQPNGTWNIPANYLERAKNYETERGNSLNVNVKSWLSLEAQINSPAETWLDREPADDAPPALKAVKVQRQKWLNSKGLLHDGQTKLSKNQGATLRKQEIERAEQRIAAQTGRAAIALKNGEQLSGSFESVKTLAQGRFAVIGNSKEFTLVPWRASIERHRGRELIATRTQSGLSWALGRQRHRGLER